MTTWMNEDWLPELEAIEWPRLNELRAEHRRLLGPYTNACSRRPELERQFATEDESVRAAELAAARSGGTPAPVAVTPALRREAQLQVADERLADATRPLTTLVQRARRELYENFDEAETAVKEAIEAMRGGEPGPRRAALERDRDALRSLVTRLANEQLAPLTVAA